LRGQNWRGTKCLRGKKCTKPKQVFFSSPANLKGKLKVQPRASWAGKSHGQKEKVGDQVNKTTIRKRSKKGRHISDTRGKALRCKSTKKNASGKRNKKEVPGAKQKENHFRPFPRLKQAKTLGGRSQGLRLSSSRRGNKVGRQVKKFLKEDARGN